jgi:hypothetical protein
MGIVSATELAREAEFFIGQPAVAKRAWTLTLSDDTLSGNPLNETEVFAAIGVATWYDVHPRWSALYARRIKITERAGDSPYHVDVVVEYGPTQDNEILAPLSRAPVWTFESKGGEVPALYYYEGSGNGDMRPLMNSAYDYFHGLTTAESMVKATCKRNFASFPTAQMAATNSINSSSYFGGPTYTWKCEGVNVSQVIELHNNNQYSYWAAQIELLYRQTGWVLQLPDVGWNFLDGSEKRRAMVFDFKNGEWVPSANPIGLDGGGGQTFGEPAILPRRVNPAANFTTLFGTPPS